MSPNEFMQLRRGLVPILFVTIIASITTSIESFQINSRNIQNSIRIKSSSSSPSTTTQTILYAKRKKNEKPDDIFNNQWYDEVDSGATPDDVFWDEMQRQKSIYNPNSDGNMQDPLTALKNSSVGNSGSNTIGNTAGGGGGGSGGNNNMNTMNNAQQQRRNSKWGLNKAGGGGMGGIGGVNNYPSMMSSSGIGIGANGNSKSISNMPARTIAEEKSTDAVLASFSAHMVDDNWLDEEYIEQMRLLEEEEKFFEEQDLMLGRQLEEWENGEDEEDDENNGEGDEMDEQDEFARFDSSGSRTNEPWDYYRPDGVEVTDDEDELEDVENMNKIKIDLEKARSDVAKEFLVEDFEDDLLEQQKLAEEEEKHLKKLEEIKLFSPRLEKARNSPKAKAFFSRPPNEIEGFEIMWASAIDNACVPNLSGSFRNLGVEFADNFGDWQHGCDNDAFQTIEDIASYKARKVYEITGLPTIASRTSFEIEPARVPDKGTPMNRGFQNTRVTSGYRFNDVGDHVDYIVEALNLFSEPTRVTRFRSCFCFYDGEMEIFDYGELDCDIYFCNSMRTYIPMSSGISEIGKTLQLTFGFEFQGWLRKKVRDALKGSDNTVSLKLRDRVLKEGQVLPNDIIDVSAFMDSMVDVNLMDDCAGELANRFEFTKPTKILTIATTGLVLAIPMAKYLQVPVVYARKERNVVMSDTYKAGYSSNTVGKNRELLVSKKHLDPDDRILIVDDFLSSGASQEALLRIVSDSGAKTVGLGVLLEKSYDAGRQSLSGYNIPIESLVRVASVANGIITLEEEEGFTKMENKE